MDSNYQIHWLFLFEGSAGLPGAVVVIAAVVV